MDNFFLLTCFFPSETLFLFGKEIFVGSSENTDEKKNKLKSQV